MVKAKRTRGLEAHDGVVPGTPALRAAPMEPTTPRMEPTSDGVEPRHTFSTEGRSRMRMLLSFQRPSHLFWEGGSFPAGAPKAIRPRSGSTSIAPNRGRAGVLAEMFPRGAPHRNQYFRGARTRRQR